ncbi:MAG: hypothetical protein E5W76_03275, partial [Mesorhizobium sp.]
MNKSVGIAIVFFCGAVAVGSTADLQRYSGICEPSGGAFIGASTFAVATDESNVIRIYERGSPAISASVDLTTFTGYEKSDLEGATARGDIVYWTASQSNSSGGRDKK